MKNDKNKCEHCNGGTSDDFDTNIKMIVATYAALNSNRVKVDVTPYLNKDIVLAVRDVHEADKTFVEARVLYIDGIEVGNLEEVQ